MFIKLSNPQHSDALHRTLSVPYQEKLIHVQITTYITVLGQGEDVVKKG